jgi:hypothetical protein
LYDSTPSFTHDPRSGSPDRASPPESEVTMRSPLDPLRVMAWNLCHGGRGGADDDPDNPARLADLVASLAPDVLCCTETAGAAELITETCNRVTGG